MLKYPTSVYALVLLFKVNVISFCLLVVETLLALLFPQSAEKSRNEEMREKHYTSCLAFPRIRDTLSRLAGD
jgi:hypothetical protein